MWRRGRPARTDLRARRRSVPGEPRQTAVRSAAAAAQGTPISRRKLGYGRALRVFGGKNVLSAAGRFGRRNARKNRGRNEAELRWRPRLGDVCDGRVRLRGGGICGAKNCRLGQASRRSQTCREHVFNANQVKSGHWF